MPLDDLAEFDGLCNQFKLNESQTNSKEVLGAIAGKIKSNQKFLSDQENLIKDEKDAYRQVLEKIEVLNFVKDLGAMDDSQSTRQDDKQA